MTLLSRPGLIEMMNKEPPLVENMIDPSIQIQPNGIELTLRYIETFAGKGSIAFENKDRILPETERIDFEPDGWVNLPAGCYKIMFNEIVNIPKNLAAIAKPRSSILRCGVSIQTAVWDAGYSGRSESLLVVHNMAGFRIKKDARVMQLLFFRLENEVKEGYSGVYQNENK